MSRRTKKKQLPFEDAWDNIRLLERRVMHQMEPPKLMTDALLSWMFPDKVVRAMKDAYPIIREIDRGSSIMPTITLPNIGGSCDITVYCGKLKMCCPDDTALDEAAETGGGPVGRLLEDMHRVHYQFWKVRRVIHWLNLHATVGAARHYCPWITPLLPEDHAFHKANGLQFKTPDESMTEIVPLMREAGVVIASALMCPPDSDRSISPRALVQFTHDWKGYEDDDDKMKRSQQFPLTID